MANISSAHGIVTITADSKDELVTFITLHFLSNRTAYYSTRFDELDDLYVGYTKHSDDTITRDIFNSIKESISTIITDTQLSGTRVQFTFTASGRWSFANNIDNLFSWLFDYSQTVNNNIILDAAEHIKQSNFTLDFDYIDEEQGMGILAEIETTLTYRAGDVDTTVTDYTDYEYSARNLIDLCDYTDVLDFSMFRADPLNYIKNVDLECYPVLKYHLSEFELFVKDINADNIHDIFYDVEELLVDYEPYSDRSLIDEFVTWLSNK